MPEAEVQIDASKGLLIVKGDQAFVSETLEKFRSVFEKPVAAQIQADSQEKLVSPAKPASSGDSLSEYPNLFDVDGENISILVGPPGNNITTQARALILLFLFARHRLGLEPTGADLIKEQCKSHACFDPKNFASHLKSQKSFITVTGSNSALMARLTVPGRKAGEELAQKLQAGE